MSVFALLRVTPVTEADITADVAAAIDALEDHDVEYETTPMATILEADDVRELFAACASAHEAVDTAEIQTLVQVEEKRGDDRTTDDKIDAVETELGRDARSERE